MAFAVQSWRILCKICTGNSHRTYSVLQKPVTRTNFARAIQKRGYLNNNSPKIAGSLTNIPASASPIAPNLAVNFNEKANNEKNNTNTEDEEDKKQREHSWKMMKYSFIMFGVTMGFGGSYLIYELSRPDHDEHGNIIEDEFTALPYFQQMWKRLYTKLSFYKKAVQEPSRDKLLPDPIEYPYIQPPYTLVLELTDVLVHPDWTYATGWRFKKRPGVDQFLEALAPPQFEIVIYTAEQGWTAWPIIDSLDPKHYVMYRLTRDTTRFVDGHHVKDLNALNRDLKKVIVIDWNEFSAKFHPENTLKIPRWSGNDDDTTLYDLAAFLKTIYTTNVEDVRDVITYYQQFDNPLEAFRENRKKLLMQMEEDESIKTQKENAKILTSKWSPSFLRSH